MSMRIRISLRAVLLSAMVAGASSAFCSVVTWDAGGGNNLWSNPTNWSPDGVPGPTDDVVITNATSFDTVLVDQDEAVKSVDIGNGAIVLVDGARTLTLNGPAASTIHSGGELQLQGANPGGTLTGNGAVTVDGILGVHGNCTLSGSGAVTITSGGELVSGSTGVSAVMTISRNITNNTGGKITFISTSTKDTVVNGAAITNTGLIDFQNDQDILLGSGSPVLNNNSGGVILKSAGSGTTSINFTVNNAAGATIETQAGDLQLDGGGIVSGTYVIAFSRIIRLGAGTFAMSGSPTVSGSGDLNIDGATLNAGAGVDITFPNLGIFSGMITGPGAVRVSGTFHWRGGTIAGSGARVLNSTSVPTVFCNLGNCQLDGATLQFQASGTYSASSNALVFSNGASLVLDPGRGLHVNNDGDFVNGGGAASSIVIGGYSAGYASIHKTTTSGMSVVGVPVTISGGAFNLDAGTLRITAGVTVNAGSPIPVIDYDPGCTIEVTGGVFLFNANSSLPLSGDFKVSGGTLRVATGVTITMPNLTLESGVVDGGGTLILSGTSTWSGGTMGSATAPGGITRIDSGNTLDITSVGPKTLTQTRQLLNNGTVSYGATSPNTLTMSGNSKITNNGSLDLTPGAVINLSGSALIENDGTINKNGFGASQIFVPLDNHAGATVSVNASTLALSGGGTERGTFTVASGANLILGPGPVFTMLGSPNINGPGTFTAYTVDVGDGPGGGSDSLTVSAPIVAYGTISLKDATLQASSTFSVSGTIQHYGGAISGSGTMTINSGGVLNSRATDSAATIAIDTTINSGGTLNFTDDVFQHGLSGNITVTNNGTIDFQSDGGLSSFSGAPQLVNNTGTLGKSAGSGTTGINVPVDSNSGSTVQAASGTLAFNQGADLASVTISGAGTVSVPATSAVSGTTTLNGKLQLTGNAAVSGTLNAAGTLLLGSGVNVTWPNVNLSAAGSKIDGAGDLHVSGNFTWSGGTITGSGSRVLNSSSTPAISCSAGNCLLDGATLQLQAWGTYSASSNALVLSNGASLILDPGKVLFVTSDGDFVNGGGAASSITVGGFASGANACIQKTTTAGTSIISVPVALSGSFMTVTGTLQLSAGVTVTGPDAIVHYDSGTTIEVTGGVFLFTAGSVAFPALGDFKVSAGTLRVPTGVTMNNPMPNVTLEGSGVIDGGGTLILAGTNTWAGGTMGSATAPGGITRINSGSTLNVTIAGTPTLTQGRIVRNNGTLNLPAGGGINLSGSGTIENNGTIAKNTSGTSTIQPRVENNSGGTVSVSVGNLSLNGGGTADGAYSISSSTFLHLGGGTFTMSGNPTVTGAGRFSIVGGATLDAGAGVDVTLPDVDLFAGTITGAGTVRVSGDFDWFGGTIAGSGPRVLNSTSTPTINCSAANCLLDGATLRLQAWGTYSASANALVLSNGASLILDPGQVLFVSDDGDFVSGGGAASSIVIGGFGSPGVNGCIEKTTTSGTSVIGVPVTMSGSFKTVTGTLQAAAGVTIAAAGAIVHYDPGTTIEVTGGVFLLASGVSFPANGAFKVSGGTLRIPTSVSVTIPNLTLQGGVVDGGGTLHLTGTSTWAGGTMGSATAPGGITQVNSGNTLNITNAGSQTLTQGRELLNAGTIDYSGTSTLTMAAGGKITNNTNFNLTADGNISVSGSATIDNNGTLTKSGGSGTSTLFPVVNSSGTVSATTGTLALAGGGTPYTDVVPTAPATIAFPSGTHSILGTIGGTGTLAISGANVTVDNPFTVGALSVTAGTATLDANGSADAFNMTGGTLGGSGTLTLTNGGTWSGGTMSGSGTTVNPAAKSFGISAPVTLNSRTLQNDGTVTVSGDITGSGTIANNGTLDTTANLTLGAALNNNGQVITSNALSLAGGGTHTGSFTVTSPGDLSFSAGTHSMSGGGSITGTGTLSFDGATVTIGVPVSIAMLSVTAGTATLDANGSAGAFTMNGGTLGGSGMLTLTNGGTWSGGTMSGSGTTVNPATKTVSISAPVTLNSRTLQNDGTLSVNGNVTGSGTIVNNGTLDTAADVTIGAALNNNGQIATTTLLALGGNGVHSGTFTATAPGVIDFSGGTQTISGALAGTGTLRFSGAAATVTGTWTGMPIEVTGGSAALDTSGTIPALTLSGGTLTGSGDVTVSGPSTWSGGTIAGSGDFTFGTGATVTMPGTNAVTLSRPLLNQGTINYTAASNGMVIAGVAVTNDGTLDIQSSQPITATPGTPPFVNHGTLKRSSGPGVMQFGAPLSNSSQVRIESGTMEFGGTYTQTAGTTTILSGATLQTETLSVDGGTLTGNGTVVGTVDNNAAVAPGASPGTLTIDGDFVQSSDGILKIELAGTTPGTQYDRVLVTGSVHLDGTLSVTTSSGFTPAAGNAFQILTFGSRLYNSTFDVMNGLNGSGFVLVPTFRSDDLRLITTLEANLGVTASAPSSVVLGNAFAYTVGVFNGGAADANSVSVTAALPPNVTFTGATPPICTGAPNLVCSVGHLNHGSTATVVISVTADALGAAPITVATTASEPDSHPANNTAAASTNITAPVADVAVAVTGAGSTIAGTKVIYTITVSNSGPDTAANIAVTATASPGLTFSANSGACVGSFPCNIATLGAGQSATIHSAWDIAPSATGNVQLTVNASAAADVNASNNSDIAVTNIGTCPDITIVAPEVMTTGLAGEATVTGLGGAAYHWSIVNGTIDKGAGTGTIEFTAGEPGTTTLAVNVTGSGCSLSATWDVTVRPRCVGTAMPAAPADGAIAQAVVDFAWSVVDDASGYRLWLQRDGAPAQNLGTALGTTCTRIIPPGTYQWFVETLFDGCASHESERRTVTILPAQDCASREKPQLMAPANELPATSAAVAFSWNAVPQALEYELWLALAGGAPTLIRNTSDTSYTAIVPPGRLEWYVRAIFAGCAATESAHRAFTYTQPPQCTSERPLLIAPAEGERLTSPVSFEWTRVSGATSYELYVDGELAATTTDPRASDLSLPRAERRWKVRARLGEGCGAADSPESRLVVIPPSPSCAPLGTPVLSAPARISSGIAGRIQWTFVSGATAYEVEISGDPEFPRGATSSSIVTARQLPVTFTNQGSAPVARYVRVHAVDTSCVEPKIGPFSPAAELFVLPPTGSAIVREGAAMMTDPTDVQYTLSIAAEHAGQSFTATPTVPWLSVTPASGVVPPGGQTLRAVANNAGLPAGTNIGTVEITTTDTTATSGALKPLGITTSLVSVLLNNNSGVSSASKSTPPQDALIIPAVANVKNFVVRYESDISVTNTSAEPMTYEINFVPTGAKGISEGKKTKSPVPPGATMFINDIVDTWFGGQSSTGTLEIRPVTETATSTSSGPDGGADRTTFAASRTFSTTDDVGTYGQYIPAVPYRNFVAKGRTLSMQQIAQSATTKVHTNLGLVEGSGQPVSLEVRIFDAAGTLQASFPRDLNGGEQLQLNSVLKEHGIDDLADGRIEVEVTSETGKVTAYASVIDDRTKDAQLVPAVTLDYAEHSKWVVPGVTGSGDWQTDVRIFNAGAEAADLTLAFYSTNGGPPATKTIQLKAGEVQQLDRVLSFFGLSGDTGALHVSSTVPAQVVVTARTYYQQTASGSFGQFIVAGTSDDVVSAGSPRQLQILQMEASADFQSIIGLAEVSGEPVTLKVEVLLPKASATVGLDVELKPNEFRQIDLASFGLRDVYNARITVRATGGKGQALAYGSLIDRKTGDPTYIPGQ